MKYVLLLLMCLVVSANVHAGGLDSTDPADPISAKADGDKTPTLAQQLRADRKALEALLKRPAPRAEVKKVLTKVKENRGQTGMPVVFWLRLGVTPVLEQWSVSDGAIKCLATFSDDLKARGIHLIVVPVPTSVTTHTHRLSDKIKPNQDLMPEYTQGLIDLIDAGVEVVDLRQAFAEAADLEKDPMMNRADFHWATSGIALAVDHLAPRLKRLEGIRALESRPQDWKRGTRTIDQPDMSLSRGNDIWSDRGGDHILYKTKTEAFRANKIPLKEKVIWFTYEGEDGLRGYRTWGPPRGGALDHPFIVIGDSQAREHTDRGAYKAMHGGGLANQLSARLGILGTTFSMNGDVDRVPSVFVKNEFPQLTRTKALILVGRMGDFCQGGWKVPDFPDAGSQKGDQAKSSDAVKGRVSVVLSEAASLPDPDAADYKDALVTAVATITKGPHKGKKIKVITLGMRDRTLVPELKKWRNAARLELKVSSWDAKQKSQPELSSIQMLDQVEDLTMVEYWADVVSP